MNRLHKGLVAGLAFGAVSLGIGVPALAAGVRASDIASGTGQPGIASEFRMDREALRAEHQGVFAAALAEELGIDEDRVTDAIDAVREELQAERAAVREAELEERLDAAVEAGELTREQADALLAAHEAGVLGRESRGGHRGGPQAGRAFGPMGR